jgi:two-component system, NtrC family, nitrogen regulation sensor histidine kinase NtrY
MKASRYTLIVTLRIVLIVLNCFALVWLYTQTSRPATTLFVFMLLAYQTGSLIYYHNRINRDLANFLIFLQENDPTLAFSKKRIERSFHDLTFQLDKINQKLQDARVERERHFQYLRTVVNQVDTGIIAYDQTGRVEIFNRAAQELLGISFLHHIDSLSAGCPELAAIIIPVPRITAAPVKITTNGSNRMLAVKSGSLKFDQREIRLISFQDIRPELDAGELDAWRRLIRTQRHEIMNTMTPVTTLTIAIKRLFTRDGKQKALCEITDEHIDDALKSVEVIEDRSRGLIDFIERFRSLTDVPQLKTETFALADVVEAVSILFSNELESRNITIQKHLSPENISLHADKKLLEQVLINLVKNSLEAIERPEGEITIKAWHGPQNITVIEVTDNGTGIEESAVDSIFVPSYTTKENGSGIGLSITRQIVHMHKGTISVKSVPGKNTTFEIVLPD